MKVFILEDDPYRYEGFLAALPETAELHHATSAIEGRRLWSPPYDLALLDYDLEGKLTGRQFLAWNLPGDVKHYIVHSWNPEGGDAMCLLLARRGTSVERLPFGAKLLRYIRAISGPYEVGNEHQG